MAKNEKERKALSRLRARQGRVPLNIAPREIELTECLLANGFIPAGIDDPSPDLLASGAEMLVDEFIGRGDGNLTVVVEFSPEDLDRLARAGLSPPVGTPLRDHLSWLVEALLLAAATSPTVRAALPSKPRVTV